jgi:ABC-type transport system involved in cytochrome bd biosynthesis fused ATPase/permease subunit
MWLYACYGRRLLDHRLESRFLRLLTVKYVGSVVVYAVAVLVSLAAFKLGLALCVGLTLLYLAPPHFPMLGATMQNLDFCDAPKSSRAKWATGLRSVRFQGLLAKREGRGWVDSCRNAS